MLEAESMSFWSSWFSKKADSVEDCREGWMDETHPVAGLNPTVPDRLHHRAFLVGDILDPVRFSGGDENMLSIINQRLRS